MLKQLKTAKLLLMTGVLLLTLLPFREVKAGELVNVNYEVTRRQVEARGMLKMLNDFRTGNTWYWNPDNRTKTYLRKGELPPLKYDAALERAAIRRAEEIALYYEHIRPNGERCFSIFPEGRYKGENLAYGQKTAERVHEAWKEENLDYAGQGHRRNLLGKHYRYVGIGCVVVDGVKFWAQAFSDRSSGETLSPPDESTVIVSTDLKRNYIKKMGFMVNDTDNGNDYYWSESYSPEAIMLKAGENKNLGNVMAYVSTADNLTTPILGVKIRNSVVDEKIASLSEDGVITGKTTGNTRIMYEADFPNGNHREFRDVRVADAEGEEGTAKFVTSGRYKDERVGSSGTRIAPAKAGKAPKVSLDYLENGQVRITFRQPKGGRYLFYLADNREMRNAFRFSSGKLRQTLTGLKRRKRYFIRIGVRSGNRRIFSEVKELILR